MERRERKAIVAKAVSGGKKALCLDMLMHAISHASDAVQMVDFS
jgi:hypothetical protein